MAVQLPLADYQLAKYPSLFAESNHPDCTEKYRHINTAQIIHQLRQEDWHPFTVLQSRSRSPDGRSYVKHAVRFRKGVEQKAAVVGEYVQEIVLENSHNRSSAYKLNNGIYRYWCANGCTVEDATFQQVSIPHRGDNIMDRVLEGVYTVIEQGSNLDGSIDRLKEITLQEDQQLTYAEAATLLLYPSLEEAPFEPRRLLTPRRAQDRRDDLFTVYNRVQEAGTKGGITYYKEGKNGERRNTTRAKTAVDANLGFNRALWHLTSKMADLLA